MNSFTKNVLFCVSIYIGRWIYLSKTSQSVSYNEARLFDAKKLGTVKEFGQDKRIETVTEGVYAAIDYALASSIIIVQNNKWFIIDTTENCEGRS